MGVVQNNGPSDHRDVPRSVQVSDNGGVCVQTERGRRVRSPTPPQAVVVNPAVVTARAADGARRR